MRRLHSIACIIEVVSERKDAPFTRVKTAFPLLEALHLQSIKAIIEEKKTGLNKLNCEDPIDINIIHTRQNAVIKTTYFFCEENYKDEK